MIDEIDELVELLRFLPERNILCDSFRPREIRENDMDHDRLATAAMEHFGRDIDVIDQEERDKNAIDYAARFGIDPPTYTCELVGVPEAVIDAVRWRLQRLRAALRLLHRRPAPHAHLSRL